MQSVNYSGMFGEVLKHDEKTLKEMLENKNVERIEVFKATNQEIKDHNKFRMGKRFKKVPKIKCSDNRN